MEKYTTTDIKNNKSVLIQKTRKQIKLKCAKILTMNFLVIW